MKRKSSLFVLFPISLFLLISCDNKPTRSDYRDIVVFDWIGGVGHGRDIYATDLEGSYKLSLTETGDNYGPCISRDGTRIAFVSTRDSIWNKIFVMYTNGYDQQAITLEDRNDGEQSWSPDGSKIVFKSTADDLRGINIMNSDGTNVINIVNAHELSVYWPSFTPDGSKILFVSHTNEPPSSGYELFEMDLDGSNRRRITHNDIDEGRPSYSPDGTKIVFYALIQTYPSYFQIFILESDNLHNISNSESDDFHPSWSPDGTRIVFGRIDGDNSGLHIMDSDGSNVDKIPNTDGTEQYPCWSLTR
jgi:TolB protein